MEQLITERFTGRIEQVPNVYSAIKVNGQRAYDLAREGKDVELKARPVTIEEFNVRQARYGYTHMIVPARNLLAQSWPRGQEMDGLPTLHRMKTCSPLWNST